jgi:hypothetical protein
MLFVLIINPVSDHAQRSKLSILTITPCRNYWHSKTFQSPLIFTSQPPPPLTHKKGPPQPGRSFIRQFEAGWPASFHCFLRLSNEFAVDDFAKAQFRSEHDPFDEQAVLLLGRFETAFRREK